MRTIRFRGICCHCDEWAYGNLVDYGEDELPEIQGFDVFHEGIDEWKDVTVERDTIGQFTGLYDKNGEEIYEGDIVRHPYIDPIFGGLVTCENEEDNPVSEVVFNEGSFALRFRDTHYYLGEFVRKNVAEVVGNVHDNPKLLENDTNLRQV